MMFHHDLSLSLVSKNIWYSFSDTIMDIFIL